MNDSNSLAIENFTKLLRDYCEKTEQSLYISSLIQAVVEYYYYALASYNLFQESQKDFEEYAFNRKLSQAEIERNNEIIRNKMIATAFGVYTSGRVCLDVCSNLSDFVEEFTRDKALREKLEKFRKANKEFALDFIDKRNIVVIHPTQKQNKKCNCFPNKKVELSGYGTGGLSFDVVSLITGDISKEYEIIPYQDLVKLQRYLKELASIYEEFFVKGD
jgi:hypothetical protein